MAGHPRSLLLGILLAVFLAGGLYALLAVSGWRIDLANFRVVKTGGIFLRYVPAAAEIFVNGVLTDETPGLLNRGVLIKKLIPGTYSVEVRAEGHATWTKRLEVHSGEVAAASEIILWPEVRAWETLEEGVRDFWLTPAGIVRRDTDRLLRLATTTLRGAEVALAEPWNNFLITKEGNTHFLTDLRKPTGALNLDHLFLSLKERELGLPGVTPILDIAPHPFSPQKFLILTETSLYGLDTRKIGLERLAAVTSTAALTVSANEAFVADHGGAVVAVNLVLKALKRLDLGAPPKELAVNESGTALFALMGDRTLLVYNRSAATTTRIAEGAASFLPSPDGERIIFMSTKGEVGVYHLKEYTGDVRYAAGTTAAIPGNLELSSPPVWLPGTGNHLLIREGDVLRALELDSREPLNAPAIATSVKSFALDGKTLYVLAKDGILRATKLEY